MKAQRNIFIGVACALVLSGITWVLARPPERSFGGQTLTYWLDNYFPPSMSSGGFSGGGFLLPNPRAEEALRQIGTNAIPALLQMSEAQDSPLKLKLVALARKQHLIPIRFTSSYQQNYRAGIGFSVLGYAASNAVPRLIKVVQSKSPQSQEMAIGSLGCIGPAAKQAVPVLCSKLSGPVPNINVRRACVQALGRIHAEPEQSLPPLMELLDDPALQSLVIEAIGRFEVESGVPALIQICDLRTGEASHAATALGLIGPAAREAVPSLLRGLADTNLDVEFRLQCILALGRIHSKPELVVPALITSIGDTLNDSDVRIRLFSATALGRFGTDARPATLVMAKLLQDPNRNVRLEATNALYSIDPEALKKAGGL